MRKFERSDRVSGNKTMGQFLGYRIKTTNIGRVEKILRDAKANLHEAAMSEYHRLLSQEICELVDDITLGVVQRPEISILEAATAILNDKINRTEVTSSGTEYDLRAGVSIIPDKQYTYLILSVANPAMEEAFRASHDIEDYRVSEEEVRNDTRTAAAVKWDELRQRCQNAPSLMNATLTNHMTVDPERLEFDSPIVRAKVRARRRVTTHFLNSYAAQGEIKSKDLMPLLDKALAKMTDEDVQAELEEAAAQLAQSLVVITMNLVMHDPRQPAAQTFDEARQADEATAALAAADSAEAGTENNPAGDIGSEQNESQEINIEKGTSGSNQSEPSADKDVGNPNPA